MSGTIRFETNPPVLLGHEFSGTVVDISRIPDSFSSEQAALSQPFAVAVQAETEISKVRLEDVALVSGPALSVSSVSSCW